MKLVSFRGAGARPRVGAVVRDRVIDLSDLVMSLRVPNDRAEELSARGIAVGGGGIRRLLNVGSHALEEIAEHVEALARYQMLEHCWPVSKTALLAPVPRPGKIVAVGRNYADHAKETGVAPFEQPRLIAKLPSSVVGPGATVKRPPNVVKMDFEAELGVVIGEFAAHVSRARALDYVVGYTALDDVSAREFQFDVTPPQTTFAKSMDGFCPMGPWLVTKDEIPNPQALEIVCHVNGELMQRASTADMIFPVDALIEYISRYMTLEPGDVIATGTPAGVGAFRDPPRWLKPGDRVRIEISRVGVLEHDIA